MNPRRTMWAVLLSLLVCGGGSSARGSGGPQFSKIETAVLKACEGLIHLFRRNPDSIWPGYNLADRPFLVYVPEKWALLFNFPDRADGFEAYPSDWPDLGVRVLYHPGRYRDLAGQLQFDFPLGEKKVVAVGFPESLWENRDRPDADVFAFIVHEAFHQFQNETFGEIPWEREERYPILDAGNTALAVLEMRILEAGLEALAAGRREAVEEGVRKFAAVRQARWAQAGTFVSRYEQGQEIREGTASYVEKKASELGSALDYVSALPGGSPPCAILWPPTPA